MSTTTLSPPHILPRPTKTKKRAITSAPTGPAKRRWHSSCDLAPAVWAKWLCTMVHRDDVDGAISVNGHILDDAKKRGLYRYLREQAAPSFFKADEWCVFLGVRVDDFLSYAEARGVSPWATGKAPTWEVENLTAQDLLEIAVSWPLPAGVVDEMTPVEDGTS
jgi:hypothetical protein